MVSDEGRKEAMRAGFVAGVPGQPVPRRKVGESESGFRSVAFLENEVLGALGEAFCDDLSVERVREDFGPVLEGSVGGDEGGATVVVAFADDLKSELGLGSVHGEDSEVIDREKLGAYVAAESLFERAMELGGVQLVEQFWRGHDDDASGGLASLIGERAREKCLAGPRRADEERIDAVV
jgi:hypothetical protein